MNCEKCGRKLKSGTKFCPSCGAPVTVETKSDESKGSNVTGEKKVISEKKIDLEQLNKKISGLNKKAVGIAIAAVAVLGLLLMMLLRPKMVTITPNDYTTITCKGLDGEGVAEISFDVDAFLKAIKAEKNLKPAQESEIRGLLAGTRQYFNFSKTEGLSNGDKIKIHSDMPENLLKEYRIKIKNKDLEYKIAGLTEIQSVNLEEYGNVSFSGFDGYGYASCYLDYESLYSDTAALVRKADNSSKAETYIKEELYSDIYQCIVGASVDRYNNLSNQDEITVIYQVNESKNRIDAYGIVFIPSENIVTVEGLDAIETIDLTEYLTFTVGGFDGYGKLRASLDTEKMESDLEGDFDGRNGYTEEEVISQIENTLDWYVSIESDKNNTLSNGEEVQLYVTIPKDSSYLYAVGILLKGGEKTVEVKELESVITLSLQDCIDFQFEGYNGAGELKAEINQSKLEELFAQNGIEERNGYTLETIAEQVKNYIEYNIKPEITPSEDFTNGDRVHVKIEQAEEEYYISEVGIIIASEDFSITAQGLEEPKEVDLMDILSVTFSGTCPYVRVDAQIDYDNPLYSYVDVNSYYNIPSKIIAYNGDTLDITLEYNEKQALRNGYSVINALKSYEITGLSTYDYLLDSIEEKGVQEIAENAILERKQRAVWNESSLLEQLQENDSKILYNKMKVGLRSVTKYYSESAYNLFNRNAFLYEISLPILRKDDSVACYSVYVIQYLDNICEDSDGMLSYREESVSSYYYTLEEAENVISNIPSEIYDDGWSSYVQTEADNPLIEEQLAFDPSETEQQTVVFASYEEPEVSYPEISSSTVNQAVAMIEYDGSRYYLFDECLTWTEAKKLCEQAGGHLAVITNRVEQRVIRDLIEKGSMTNYWLGATDEKLEGSWEWVTQEKFFYTGWESNQPDNYNGKEHYLVISKNYNSWWNDVSADKESGFILEVSAEGKQETDDLTNPDIRLLTNQVSFCHWRDNSYGERHYAVRSFDASNSAWEEYALDGEYSRMTGQVSVCSEAASGVSMDIAMFADGVLILKKCGMNRLTEPVTFDLDLDGVRKLVIVTRNTGEYDNGFLDLEKIKLYAAGQTAIPEDADLLSDCTMIQGNYAWRRGYLTDSFGNVYEHSMEFQPENEDYRYGIWNLNGEYETFSGTFVTSTDTGAGVSMDIQIYGDEELLWETSGFSRLEDNLSFSVDVTGRRLLRIVTNNATENGSACLYLVNDQLAGKETNRVTSLTEEAEVSNVFPVLSLQAANKVTAMKEYDGHRYYLFEEPLTWKEAKEFCEKEGGHLAVITSSLEQRRIEELLYCGSTSGYWIGGTDEEEEGNWIWVTGEEMLYTYWEGNNPDNYAHGEENENYLMVYRDGFGWNDERASKEQGFILEFSKDEEIDSKYVEIGMMSARYLGRDGYEYRGRAKDIHGTIHLSSYFLNAASEGWVSYDLNGEFLSMSGNIASYEDTSQDALMDIGFFGDGKLLYAVTGIMGRQKVQAFHIDLTGVKTLTIRTSNSGNTKTTTDAAYLLLNETVFTYADKSVTCSNPITFDQLQEVDSVGLSYHKRIFKDTYGGVHDSDMCLDVLNGGCAVYLLNGMYSEVSAVLTSGVGTHAGNLITVRIYGDDELLFEKGGLSRLSDPIPVSIDVTNKKLLKIEVSDSGSADKGYFYLTEEQFILAESAFDSNLKDKHEFAGHQYQYFDLSLSWEEAKKYCEEIGGHLAVISNSAEQAFIEQMIADGAKYQYWLGGYRDGKDFIWITGEEFSYSNWDTNEPNNSNEMESCVEIYRKPNPRKSGSKAYCWNDISPENLFEGEKDFFSLKYVGFICEWE